MQIEKARLDADRKLEIEWKQEGDVAEATGTVRPKGEVPPDFLIPWEAALPHVLGFLGFDVVKDEGPGENVDAWELRSIRFDHLDEMLTVSFTVLRDIPVGTTPLVINTPKFKMAAGKAREETGQIPLALRKLLRQILDEAERIAKSSGSQLNLFPRPAQGELAPR